MTGRLSPQQMDKLFDDARSIPILTVLDDYFGINLHAGTRSWKIHCPWSLEHKHPGEKSYRVYPDTNSSFCFAMHGPMDSVDLVSKVNGVSRMSAAKSLVGKYGLGGLTWQERYQAVLVETEKARQLSNSDISAAINLRLSRIEGYDLCRYDNGVIQALRSQLAKPADGWTVRRLTKWMDETERLVTEVIQEVLSGTGKG